MLIFFILIRKTYSIIPDILQNQLQSSSNQISGHLATSQQANSNMSPSLIMSNLSTTPLQQPSSNSAGGMGLRRSSRLYNGSNQLKVSAIVEYWNICSVWGKSFERTNVISLLISETRKMGSLEIS